MSKRKAAIPGTNLKPVIRLAIMSEDAESNSQFGRGIANLCLGVRELGSSRHRQLRDADSNSQFGRGVANLCLGVREFGSLNAAAKNMKMAYSKAWRIIKDTEAALGVQLLNRDGAHGSTLTEQGEKILNAYLELDVELQKYAEAEFEKRFK